MTIKQNENRFENEITFKKALRTSILQGNKEKIEVKIAFKYSYNFAKTLLQLLKAK